MKRVFARSRRKDPAQEAVVDRKDKLNDRTKKFIQLMIDLKRGWNGRPAPMVGLSEKSKITDPLPEEISKGAEIADREFEAMMEELNVIKTMQQEYSEKFIEKKQTKPQPASSTASPQVVTPQVVPAATTAFLNYDKNDARIKIGSTLFSRIWAHIVAPFGSEHGRWERLKLLRSVSRCHQTLSEVENLVLSSDPAILDAIYTANNMFLDIKTYLFDPLETHAKESLNAAMITINQLERKIKDFEPVTPTPSPATTGKGTAKKEETSGKEGGQESVIDVEELAPQGLTNKREQDKEKIRQAIAKERQDIAGQWHNGREDISNDIDMGPIARRVSGSSCLLVIESDIDEKIKHYVPSFKKAKTTKSLECLKGESKSHPLFEIMGKGNWISLSLPATINESKQLAPGLIVLSETPDNVKYTPAEILLQGTDDDEPAVDEQPTTPHIPSAAISPFKTNVLKNHPSIDAKELDLVDTKITEFEAAIQKITDPVHKKLCNDQFKNVVEDFIMNGIGGYQAKLDKISNAIANPPGPPKTQPVVADADTSKVVSDWIAGRQPPKGKSFMVEMDGDKVPGRGRVFAKIIVPIDTPSGHRYAVVPRSYKAQAHFVTTLTQWFNITGTGEYFELVKPAIADAKDAAAPLQKGELKLVPDVTLTAPETKIEQEEKTKIEPEEKLEDLDLDLEEDDAETIEDLDRGDELEDDEAPESVDDEAPESVDPDFPERKPADQSAVDNLKKRKEYVINFMESVLSSIKGKRIPKKLKTEYNQYKARFDQLCQAEIPDSDSPYFITLEQTKEYQDTLVETAIFLIQYCDLILNKQDNLSDDGKKKIQQLVGDLSGTVVFSSRSLMYSKVDKQIMKLASTMLGRWLKRLNMSLFGDSLRMLVDQRIRDAKTLSHNVMDLLEQRNLDLRVLLTTSISFSKTMASVFEIMARVGREYNNKIRMLKSNKKFFEHNNKIFTDFIRDGDITKLEYASQWLNGLVNLENKLTLAEQKIYYLTQQYEYLVGGRGVNTESEEVSEELAEDILEEE